MKKSKTSLTAIVLILFILLTTANKIYACTRVVYKGPNNTVLTARSMDFSIPIPSNLWLFPRGIEHDGSTGKNTVKWSSKYGSITTSSWDIAVSDGMNEKGLVANMLWLVSSSYPKFSKEGNSKKGLSVSLWAQYALDNFATVSEAVEQLKKEDFIVVTDFIPGTDKFTTVHLSLSDATGDNAILEYINGKLVIHHDPSYTVMTNDPVYEQQLAINEYWKGIPGNIFLPGTNRAADRYVRASYYIKAIPQTDDIRIALAGAFSVIRQCSVPYGISTEGFPNLSTTRWRTVSDQKNLVYYFEDALSPNAIWVDMKKLDFSKTGKVKKLALDNNQIYAGETSKQFLDTKPFVFKGI
ncbi:linear amide C-N hydrolase [Flavobacterium branchiarum]|uniref:Linear amide C-N hydrolase n=1 Tax=Flavobacterium branchiarum TaxID=1114870 RepID=A0ABV5FGY6_9FLAO|nr:linear amide C-N hydrolase [Flavobacterium branchiarum]MDN3673645.1 linear amide C-N hydrolase [Flavobacterium branchiarum]